MLHLKSANLNKTKIETLAIPVCEDKEIHTDPPIKAVIQTALKLKEFGAKKDEVVTLYNPPDIKIQRVILYGLGKFEKLDRETLRTMAGRTVKSCIQRELPNLWLAAPAEEKMTIELAAVIEALLEGAYLGNYTFQNYKGEKKKKALRQINLLLGARQAAKYRLLCSKVATICEGTYLARDWVSTPSNDKTPQKFASSIVDRAKAHHLKIQTLNYNQLQRKKFGALLAVAAGSRHKPHMVVLEHKAPGAKKTVALVGKGVTFDSGGLNIKTGGSIADMKSDMSGAAAVAAALITAARLKMRVNIIGAIPIVENMPSGQATRPGDIIRSHAGKTIEIGNTDAEGRLILIDAMSYVLETYKPLLLIDLATLTGACIVALGEKIAGVFSNDDDLAAAVTAAGDRTHERCWRMPLPDDYKDLLKSDFADINNMPSNRWGGAISAALFLKEFVKDVRWAHIDIAGPAYIKKENAYCEPGGSGFGVRLLIDLLNKFCD